MGSVEQSDQGISLAETISRKYLSGRPAEILGTIALVTGIALLAIAVMMGSGIFGGGTMYFIAGGLGIATLIPFIVSTCLLCKKPIESLEESA